MRTYQTALTAAAANNTHGLSFAVTRLKPAGIRLSYCAMGA